MKFLILSNNAPLTYYDVDIADSVSFVPTSKNIYLRTSLARNGNRRPSQYKDAVLPV